MPSWTADELSRIDTAEELRIAAQRADGSDRHRVPVWAVCVDGAVYVRTWHRRDDGWFGQTLATHRASIRVPGVSADVIVEDVGAGSDGLRAAVDEAYRVKYGHYGASSVDRMVGDDSAATTLRLVRAA